MATDQGLKAALRGVKTVCVIGGGSAGVAAAKALKMRGFEVSLFEEKNQLGGLWVDNYYNAAVQTQKDLYEYPEKRFAPGVSRMPTALEVVEYVTEFARENGVYELCKLRHRVVNVARTDEFSSWIVKICNLEEDFTFEQHFDFVVVATGLLEKPRMPDFPGRSDFRGQVVHSSEWKSPEVFEDKKVVVIGNGKGATDAVIGAVGSNSTEVHQVVRTKHWYVPHDIFGVLPFHHAFLIRGISCLYPSLESPHTTWGTILRTVFSPLSWTLFRVVEVLLAIHYRFPLGSLSDARVEIDAVSSAAQLPKPAFFDAVRSKQVKVHQATVQGWTKDGIVLSNGETIKADLVVMATGYSQDFPFLSTPIRQSLAPETDGMWLYRQILHPSVPGLAFIGSNITTYMSTCTFSIQSAWLAQCLTGEVKLPSKKSVLENIDGVKRVRRSVMGIDPKRSALIQTRVVEYHDLLCKDMGKSSKALSFPFLGLLADYLWPTYPRYYKSAV